MKIIERKQREKLLQQLGKLYGDQSSKSLTFLRKLVSMSPNARNAHDKYVQVLFDVYGTKRALKWLQNNLKDRTSEFKQMWVKQMMFQEPSSIESDDIDERFVKCSYWQTRINALQDGQDPYTEMDEEKPLIFWKNAKTTEHY
jgi:hypothetical protein